MCRKFNIGRGSRIDSPMERTLEEQLDAEQRGSPKTDTGCWVEGDFEVQFSQERGKKAAWEE